MENIPCEDVRHQLEKRQQEQTSLSFTRSTSDFFFFRQRRRISKLSLKIRFDTIDPHQKSSWKRIVLLSENQSKDQNRSVFQNFWLFDFSIGRFTPTLSEFDRFQRITLVQLSVFVKSPTRKIRFMFLNSPNKHRQEKGILLKSETEKFYVLDEE